MLDLQRDPLGTYLSGHRDHGDVVRFVAGPPGLRVEIYGIYSPEGVQQVLATQAAKFRKENIFYEEIRQSFGNGLLTSQDEDYVRQRRLIQPLFTRRRVDGYAEAIAMETESLVERWSAGQGRAVDAVDEMSRFALRAVSRILFGADVEAALDSVRKNFPVLDHYVRSRGTQPKRIPRSWPTPGNREAAAAERALYGVCDMIIAQRGEGAADSDDLLGLLAAARDEDGNQLDPTELRDQVLIFLLAGHETTATSLTFALHLLGHYPEVQRRVQAEVDEVFADGHRATAADYNRLPYLTMVLKEAMRLYPAAPVIGRMAVGECAIGDSVIPAGATVLATPYVVHRHAKHWPDPERFDPERFTPEAEAGRHRYAWLPFGGGPRACIGQHFSMLESVLALAGVLRAFDVEALDAREVPLTHGITLAATGPVRIGLTRR
ncbi:cytochrome P450 [Kitasatospora sp. CMC57]|uniref:Cytochrome P450 n=2 Tax=Kitasatospora sp. CMC57 TaxID=3231513 RepID=A0AB33JPZ2_9ACTN